MLLSAVSTYSMFGRSEGACERQCRMREDMAVHWISDTCLFFSAVVVSGGWWRTISISSTPKLNTSILGEWSSGYLDSGAE